jgi:hypothetical protein
MKNWIKSLPVHSEEDLMACIIEAASTIRQKPDIFDGTRQSLLHRHRLGIEFSGCTFEHML